VYWYSPSRLPTKLFSRLAPASLVVVAEAIIRVLASIAAWSWANSVKSPPASTVPGVPVKSIVAWARLLTLLLASTPLVAIPVAPYSAAAADVDSLPTVAVILASDTANSDTSPSTSTVVSRR